MWSVPNPLTFDLYKEETPLPGPMRPFGAERRFYIFANLLGQLFEDCHHSCWVPLSSFRM